MAGNIFWGLMIPFAGTALGSIAVLFMKNGLNRNLQRALTGAAAGVMMSASFWSLLIPAVEQAQSSVGRLAAVFVAAGFCLGMLFLLLIDSIIPHMHLDETTEGMKSGFKKDTMLILAVVIHNIPEGMAVGVLYAGLLMGNASVSASAALSLSIGIAAQNMPEGAIISMPLHAGGMSRGKACLQGILSGAVEPVAGLLTILLASKVIPLMPFLLSFAAGAMIYVIVEELIPEMEEGGHSNLVTVVFMLGFICMMILDILFG